MNMLRSAGLSKDDSDVILQNLQALHPPEEPEFDNFPPPGLITPSKDTFNFVDGSGLSINSRSPGREQLSISGDGIREKCGLLSEKMRNCLMILHVYG